MEIEFINVNYSENINTPLEKVYLKNISFKIDKGINVFLGDSKSGKEKIPELINAVCKPTKGIIKVGKYTNDGKLIKNINNLRMNIGYSKLNPNDMIFNKTVREELSFGINNFKYKLDKKEERLINSLKMVNLEESVINERIDSLSIIDKKKISIASTLIFNPNIIILEEPLLFLNYKEKENIKKLIKLLKNKYNKTIIILTKDSTLCYEISDKVFLMSEGKLVKEGNKNIITDSELLKENNIESPEILKFINEANKEEQLLTPTSNILDLIKEVYRNV